MNLTLHSNLFDVKESNNFFWNDIDFYSVDIFQILQIYDAWTIDKTSDVFEERHLLQLIFI